MSMVGVKDCDDVGVENLQPLLKFVIPSPDNKMIFSQDSGMTAYG